MFDYLTYIIIISIICFTLLFYFIYTQAETMFNPDTSFWRSIPRSDLMDMKTDPRDMCLIMQELENMEDCQLLQAKNSADPLECKDGMSIQGCFACQFQCQYQ